MNSIRTTYYASEGASEGFSNIILYDSFGRAYLNRKIGGGGFGGDIVSASAFDALGRPPTEWMLFHVASGVDLPFDSINAVASRFQETSRPARTFLYDDSTPLGKVAVTEAGTYMEGHPAVSTLHANTISGKYACRDISINGRFVGTLGYWPEGSLAVMESIDADGREALTFIDFRGNIVLRRRLLDSSKYADTYYIRDNLGRVLAVIPPELSAKLPKANMIIAVSPADVDAFAYRYSYDHRMLLTSKKLPGADEILYGYDRTHSLVMWSDGPLRAKGRVAFQLHDQAGRPTLSGTSKRSEVTGLESTEALTEFTEALIGSPVLRPENPGLITTSSVTFPGSGRPGFSIEEFLRPEHKYTLQLEDVEIHKQFFYDDYRFLRSKGFEKLDSICSALKNIRAGGLPTGEYTAVFADSLCPLKTEKSLVKAIRYDIEGRPIEAFATALDGHTKHTVTDYTFDGLEAKTTVTLGLQSATDVVSHTYDYDNARRLVSDILTIGHTGSDASYTDTYPATTRSYGNTGRMWMFIPAGQDGIHTRYNLRGQVKAIESRYFQQEIFYETDGQSPQYGGNVSAVKWRNYGMEVGDDKRWRYDYTYDNLDRLTAADFSQSFHGTSDAGRDYSCTYSYNLNSAPTAVSRCGATRLGYTPQWGEIDHLTITHSGNRIVTVSDAADEILLETSLDFHNADGSNVAQRTYDSAGRLISDTSRDITNITYNPAGQPMKIEFGSEDLLPMYIIYDADGNLLGRIISERTQLPFLIGSGMNSEAITHNKRTFYGSIIKLNDSIERVVADGGYISGRRFYAYYPDFKGNIQVVASNGDFYQSNHYYPYGLPFAEGERHSFQTYKYSGKELLTDRFLNLYDFHARIFDPVIGVFDRMDPFSEVKPNISSYLFCRANPIKYTDPTGLFDTAEQAEEFVRNSDNPDADIFYDNEVGKWYVITDEYDSTTGQYFGKYFGPEDNAAQTTVLLTSIAGGIQGWKNQLIDYALKGSDDIGASLMTYRKINSGAIKGLGVAGMIASTCIYQSYKAQGGDNPCVTLKYAVDMLVGTVGLLPTGPIGLAIVTVYFLGDILTDGYFIDYSIPNKTEEDNLKSKE
ncbi:MAG: hypothetical protein K2F71_03775 [Paramuribaculum sp.]|nr:hypothetical protein [Paramuribaculum sp.]